MIRLPLLLTLGLALHSAAQATETTPLGAELAGNADGSIPAWQGGYRQPLASTDIARDFIDPFASDPIELTIDHSNYQQYQNHLTPGQIEQLRRNKDGYRLNVYQTRRTAAVPEPVYQAASRNRETAQLTPDGNGVTGYQGYYPFPAPKTGLEVLWNHFMRYRGGSLFRSQTQVVTQSSGSFNEVQIEERAVWPENLNGFDQATDANVMIYAKQEVVAPARLAGNMLLVHETVNQYQQPRLAWLYNAGQRRVRRAPQVAYDGPGTAADGLRTSDNVDMYSGSPDRYEWKLEGKQEIYIPYNNHRLTDQNLDSERLIQQGHLNPELLRYEKHRVWKVVGTLREGQRHVYAKRVFYIDEDTWQIALAEHYDSRGSLWRFSEGFHVQYYYADTPWYAAEAIYDFNSSRYLVMGLLYNSGNPVSFGFRATKSEFLPAALRTSGIK
ncbi:DUF1329 domain-containing protein [Aquipseudomonas guryensis]|jgi:hypothetical protein|uniref:DUF1329 domain-containing protein n=1 Tax=Aquipseudomonas guryensis TaxID=2759165 RepID=A0A7W4DCG5_9GAMM|nr:DUF1329 domain-containing protein [Pseudomonas guryensis]MBB1520054.1 DUF1329 domain-containing protein [Pseudomonas guryensis]